MIREISLDGLGTGSHHFVRNDALDEVSPDLRDTRACGRFRNLHVRASFLLLAVFLFSLSAEADRLRVLATFAPVYSLTKNVAGDAADVEMLLPPGAEPHDFALSPSDLKKIARADVIVSNGLGIEEWLGKAVASGAKQNVVQIVASKGIPTVQDPPNPHIWLDPVLAMREVENIRDGLKSADALHTSIYEQNAAAFLARLRGLDEDIRNATSNLGDKRLLPLHDSFPYFAARYGFEIVAVVEAFPGREPSPKFIKMLRDIIRAKNVGVIFSEPLSGSRLFDSLAEDLHVRVALLDPMETGEPSAELYERVMRGNLQALIAALHGDK